MASVMRAFAIARPRLGPNRLQTTVQETRLSRMPLRFLSRQTFSSVCAPVKRRAPVVTRQTGVRNAVPSRRFSASSASAGGAINITFVLADKSLKTASAHVGQTLLEVCQEEENNIEDVEGACGGACACSTCHMIFPKDVYDQLPEPEEEELDMLDLALGVTDTSRLGCQIEVTDAFDGIQVRRSH